MPARQLPFEADAQQLWYIVPEGFRDISIRRSKDDLAREGYFLIDLSTIREDFKFSDVVAYNCPDVKSYPSSDAIKEKFESLIGRKIRRPTILVFGDTVTLYEYDGEYGIVKFAEEIYHSLAGKKRLRRYSDVCYSMEGAPSSAAAAPMAEREAVDEAEIMEGIIRILRIQNMEKLMALGLTGDTLRFILGTKREYSKMHINSAADIYLEDYDRHIKMDDKTKALYFLFLRHPEGISIKGLPEHIEELVDLYQSISGRDDKQAMRRTMENLANPFHNDINVSISRIKKAFVEAFDDDLAKAYYVDGGRNEVRKIALDRSLVSWETIR